MKECKKVIKIDPCPPKKKFFYKVKKKKKPGISLLERLLRLRRQVARITRELRSRLDQLASSIEQLVAFTSRLRTDVNALQAQISGAPAPAPSLRQVLLSRLNTPITIETDAGPISGILIEVGIDYVAVQEASGAIVLIPLDEINSFV